MPAQHLFTILPAVVPPVIPGEFDPRVFANRSTFPAVGPGSTGTVVTADLDLTASLFANLTVFPAGTFLTLGPPDGEFVPVRVVNTSSLPATTVTEAPPDGAFLPARFANLSAFPTGTTVSEAPPDGVLRAGIITNAQAFGIPVVIDEGGGTPADDYGPIAYGPPGSDPEG